MLQAWIVCCGWYFIILGASAERSPFTEGSMLDKFQQHDYDLKFERAEAVRYDKRYVKSLSVVTFKYNRTSAVVNFTLVYKQDVGFDLEVMIQAYKFASNEYRRFPMRFQFNFCQAVAKNTMGIGDFRKCGTFTECPLLKDKAYIICNWSPDPANFPPLIPSGQYMFEMQVLHHSAEMYLARSYITVSRSVPVAN